jgi:hypothetical protein
VVTNLIIFTLSMFILAKAKIPFFEIWVRTKTIVSSIIFVPYQ